MTTIYYIHGAASTPLCFNWMKQELKRHDFVNISYDSHTPLSKTIRDVCDKVAQHKTPPVILGHSLGGVIATAVAQSVPVKKIITLSTPFGGSFAASLMRWFMPTQLFKDISQQSPILVALKNNTPTIPILSFVTDSNLTILGERTDGVVTVRSQTELIGPQYIHVDLNHFEVLLSADVVEKINQFIWG